MMLIRIITRIAQSYSSRFIYLLFGDQLMDKFKQKPARDLTRRESSKVVQRETGFRSVTRDFLSSKRSKEMRCPSCGSSLDFESGVEWMGPDSFTCGSCDNLLNISMIQRALRDLGVE